MFTNLGASGRSGPTSLGSHYAGQDHDGQVTLSSGIQQWTVPYTGEYRIEAIGAAGGYDSFWSSWSSAQNQGRGARMIGTFNLSEGEVIQILVGQEGGINNNMYGKGSGGGGGTFVVRSSNTSLIVAGGGGGIMAVTSRHAGCDASTSTQGNPGYRSWSGGINGHGARTADDHNSGIRVCCNITVFSLPKSVIRSYVLGLSFLLVLVLVPRGFLWVSRFSSLDSNQHF